MLKTFYCKVYGHRAGNPRHLCSEQILSWLQILCSLLKLKSLFTVSPQPIKMAHQRLSIRMHWLSKKNTRRNNVISKKTSNPGIKDRIWQFSILLISIIWNLSLTADGLSTHTYFEVPQMWSFPGGLCATVAIFILYNVSGLTVLSAYYMKSFRKSWKKRWAIKIGQKA